MNIKFPKNNLDTYKNNDFLKSFHKLGQHISCTSEKIRSVFFNFIYLRIRRADYKFHS